MRILSARISRAHYLRDFGTVEARVTLLVKGDDRPVPYEVQLLTACAARANGAAPLRDRLIASAKLLHAAGLPRRRHAQAA
jgi:hypothetical protein